MPDSFQYYKIHRLKILRRVKKWRRCHKKQIKESRARQHIARPWVRSFYNAKTRCESPTVNKYKYYGGAGIKCLLTKDEVRQLWHRDRADLLKQPSLDRKESSSDYTFDNCQFIEFAENRAKRRNARPNMVCRNCKNHFCGNGISNICSSCRRLKRIKNARYPKSTRYIRNVALKKGMSVEAVLGKRDNVLSSILRINGKIVTVNYCNGIQNHGECGYSHFNASTREADVHCLIRQIGQRQEVFFYPNFAIVGPIFIPVIFAPKKRGRKRLIDWLKFRDAWHLFGDAARPQAMV